LSIGLIDKYEWDFDGNKDLDLSTTSGDDVDHVYSKPGYYLSLLKVRDENGLTARAYVPVVATGPDQMGAVFASRITSPETGQRVYGNSVTVAVDIIPNYTTQSVSLDYKQSADVDWTAAIGTLSYPYNTTLDTTDTAVFKAGDYDLRAPVNNNADKAAVNNIIIDPVNWDIFEELTPEGVRIKKVKVDNTKDTTVTLVDGTECLLEAGSLLGDDILTIKVDPTGFVNGGGNKVLYQREFTLDSGDALMKDATIIIPYDETGGIVDGLGIPEEDLILYYYNETTEEWEELSDYQVYTDENYVSGKVGHFSVFGLGGGAGAGITAVGSSSGDSGGGGRSCFIATATFGTPMAGEVQSLRFFRDNYMLTNGPGEFLIDMYERYSPPIADRIADSRFLKGMVRYHLKPIISFAQRINIICSDRIGPWIEKDKAVHSHEE
jgi:hypothetical protein